MPKRTKGGGGEELCQVVLSAPITSDWTQRSLTLLFTLSKITCMRILSPISLSSFIEMHSSSFHSQHFFSCPASNLSPINIDSCQNISKSNNRLEHLYCSLFIVVFQVPQKPSTTIPNCGANVVAMVAFSRIPSQSSISDQAIVANEKEELDIRAVSN